MSPHGRPTDPKHSSKSGKVKSRRGFATLTPERLREVTAKGGRSVPHHKRYFSVDRQTAIRAGRKGGTIRGYKMKLARELAEQTPT